MYIIIIIKYYNVLENLYQPIKILKVKSIALIVIYEKNISRNILNDIIG